jgi:putative tryptophan/tyrosine transport system substrate-binding protein
VRRREFITLIGGTAVAWPLAARAQQPAMPVIGFLAPVSQNEELLGGFRQGLKQAGFVEGENVSILYQFAENEIDRLPALADNLARRRVAVIVTLSQPAVVAAKAATATIPIVFVAAEDPVRLGLVASLARPGSNLTGINFFQTEVITKRLQLLRELVPTVNPCGGACRSGQQGDYRDDIAGSGIRSARHLPANSGSQCQQRSRDRCGLRYVRA